MRPILSMAERLVSAIYWDNWLVVNLPLPISYTPKLQKGEKKWKTQENLL